MPLEHFLEEVSRKELEVYKKPQKIEGLKKTHVSFTGSPRKHPHDKESVIIMVDPYSTNTFYYEFKIKDISYVEELPNIVNDEKEAVAMVKVWVKKGSVGIRSTPFIVEDLRNFG